MTPDELKQLITSKIEDDTIPKRMAEWCAKNAGKGLRRNNLPEGGRIEQQAGMTSIRFDGPVDSWNSYLIDWKIVNVVVPTVEELRKRNTCWYEGLEERNAMRRKFLANEGLINMAACLIQDVMTAKESYLKRLAIARERLTGYGGILNPDSYEIDKLIEIPKQK